jgi:hypothetical protein
MHLEGLRPIVALAGHIVVPPLPVKAGWRDRRVLSGCDATLTVPADGVNPKERRCRGPVQRRVAKRAPALFALAGFVASELHDLDDKWPAIAIADMTADSRGCTHRGRQPAERE